MLPVTKLDDATKALLVSCDIFEIKEIKSKAESLRLYFRQQGNALADQNRAAEIKLRAERKLGVLLSEMEMNSGGGNGSNQYQKSNRSHDVTGCTKTLSDIGISKMQSSRWQQIAKIPDGVFNQFLTDIRYEGEEITTQGLLRYHEVISNPTGRPTKPSKNVFSDIAENPIEPDTISQYTQIKHGDALAILKGMPDESIDCVVTSPPYYQLRDYGVDGQLGMEATVEEYIEKLCEIFEDIKRVLKPKGTCFVNIGDTYSGSNNTTRKVSDKCLLQIPSRFSIEMCNRGWILRNEIIWHKPNAVPHSVKDRFTVDFEKIFFFTKSTKYYFEQQLEQYRSGQNSFFKTSNKGNGNYSKNAFISGQLMSEGERDWFRLGGRNKRSVWSIPLQSYKGSHFAVFPPDLMEIPIQSGCPELVCIHCGEPREKIYREGSGIAAPNQIRDAQIGTTTRDNGMDYPHKGKSFLGYTRCDCNAGFNRGIVLDPFFGAGTTAIVASRLNRNWVGIEINEKYVDLAKQRLAGLNIESI